MKYRIIKKYNRFIPQILKGLSWHTIGDEDGYRFKIDAEDYCKRFHKLFEEVEVVDEFEL